MKRAVKTPLKALLLVTLTLGLGGCGGEDVPGPVEPEHPPEQTQALVDEEFEASYPPGPWVAPTLLVDSNFPNGVLNFATASGFADFYSALDTVADATSASTGSSGVTPFSATATASATTNSPSFTVKLNAGQVFEAGTCDLEGASVTGDSYLRLMLNGTEVTANDDACGTTGSRLSFTAATAGVYEVRMGCFSTGTCSGTVGYSVLTPGRTAVLSGARSYSGATTTSATAGYSTLVLHLSQGQVIDAGTCGVTGSSVAGDSYLRLIDAEGNVELVASDDACSGTGSRITYTAPRTGLYELRLGCYSALSCSGTLAYTLSAEIHPNDMVPSNFVSAKTYLATARPSEQAGDAIVDVTYSEFVDDLAAALTEDDTLRRLVDRDLQVVVEGKLYHLTNMGVFQVNLSSLAAYRAWFNANAYAINTDPNFQSIAGESSLGNGSYQVMPGVIRTVGGFGTPSVKLLGFDDDASGAATLQALPDVGSPAGSGTHGTEQGLASVSAPLRNKGAELGRISYWYGKVNAHKAPGGAWLKDNDCVSGANLDPVAYCRKFFPGTNSVVELAASAKPPNLWNSQNCAAAYSGNGERDFICDSTIVPAPSCNLTPPAIAYQPYPVGSNFKRSENIPFGNRRFVFKAKSPGFQLNIGDYEVGFHTIGIKGKLQRRKRFLGIGYWGPSYADEIVVGMDNMKLDTDYIVPYPQNYNTLARPKFNTLADYKIGNWLVKTANISVNIKVPYYPITTQDIASWTNGGINSLIGNAYTNIWKGIETHVMDAIDPTFKTRYEAYSKMVTNLDDANRLRWVMGAGEKPQCYSHQNTWRFDANAGFRYAKNGGVAGPPGTPPAKVNYKYSMKAGSFYGRARLGGSWYGIRLVRTP
ncbi:hypothetical protein [Corallococcus carmarthensis]|uniref:Peptidase C-terminal archaeal/bacterial domain-containing protein n=1 Tax=Corallococcus carmarthensis TaxID=2316728 RepID=A0A3A8KSS8_9BACT|nr:hypothetical protein [Corallococcus carmarthensis]RKH05034.1 hypothetical protein D7X32_08930 [Corallococcus carmarthensis]